MIASVAGTTIFNRLKQAQYDVLAASNTTSLSSTSNVYYNPGFDREVAILRRRLPELSDELAGQVAAATARMRKLDLIKPPGVAESIDWAAALGALGARSLDPEVAAATLGAVLKYREDIDRVRATGVAGDST